VYADAEQGIAGYNKSKEINYLALSCYPFFFAVLAYYGSRMVATPGGWPDADG